jgi:hypothetical protein
MLGENRGVKYGSIGTTLWGMDMLLEMLEKARKNSPPNGRAFQSAIDQAWELLKDYYNKTDDTPIHVVSLVLDPRMKYAYCTRNWKAEWIDEAKKKVTAFYRRYCREETEETVMTETPAEIGKMVFNVNKWRFGDTSTKEDEFTRYLNAPVLILENNEANDAFDVLE